MVRKRESTSECAAFCKMDTNCKFWSFAGKYSIALVLANYRSYSVIGCVPLNEPSTNERKRCAPGRSYDCNLYNSPDLGTYTMVITDNMHAGWGTIKTCLYDGNKSLLTLI